MSRAHATKFSDPIRKAYAVAQQQAAQAVTGWLTEEAPSERSDAIGAVYAALIGGGPDPSATLHAGIGKNRLLSDTVGELMSVSEDAGYLYGLAVGLALKNGGGQ